MSASPRTSSSGTRFHRLQKVTVATNSPAATSVCRVHLGEVEESGCGGSTRYGSNFIDGMLKYRQFNITTY